MVAHLKALFYSENINLHQYDLVDWEILKARFEIVDEKRRYLVRLNELIKILKKINGY